MPARARGLRVELLEEAYDGPPRESWRSRLARADLLLVWCGEMDRGAPPLHSYKFVAASQHAQQAEAPIALQLIRGCGHSLGRNRQQTVECAADQLCFLMDAVGLEPDGLEE